MGSWVRFAETKATILAAGLGVVLTMLVANTTTFVKAIAKGCTSASIVGGLAALTILAFLWTLFWLIRAIAPHGAVPNSHLNRFAWPSLSGVRVDQLLAHVGQTRIETDAWQQVLDLSQIAERKFDACGKATFGFAFLVIASLLGATTAAIFNM